MWKQLGYELPGGPKVMTRKPGYHYGWDWGPRLVTSGIWQPVYLQAWDRAKIESLQWVQKKITREKALLAAVFEIHSTCPGPEKAVISIVHKNKNKEKRLIESRKATVGLRCHGLALTITVIGKHSIILSKKPMKSCWSHR